MDIQLMREFIALVNLKSYRKVAQQFHIAPSTLSRHIKAIGKELGHPLFENLRAYQLTDEGQVVFERFGILVGEYDGLLQALAAQGPHYVRIAYCFEDRAISHYVRAAKECQLKQRNHKINLQQCFSATYGNTALFAPVSFIPQRLL